MVATAPDRVPVTVVGGVLGLWVVWFAAVAATAHKSTSTEWGLSAAWGSISAFEYGSATIWRELGAVNLIQTSFVFDAVWVRFREFGLHLSLPSYLQNATWVCFHEFVNSVCT